MVLRHDCGCGTLRASSVIYSDDHGATWMGGAELVLLPQQYGGAAGPSATPQGNRTALCMHGLPARLLFAVGAQENLAQVVVFMPAQV